MCAGCRLTRDMSLTPQTSEGFEGLEQAHWASPIVTCVKNFKGGTLIVNSAPFKAALMEAERIWVEENIDYKTEEDKQQTDQTRLRNPSQSDDRIHHLEMEIKRLSFQNQEMSKELSPRVPNVPYTLDDALNKPQDVAEVLVDIYENEWQIAFEYLTQKKKFKEREAIEELLKILENCFEFCELLAEDHMLSLKEFMIAPTSNQHLLKRMQLPKLPEDGGVISTELAKVRRSLFDQTLPVVEQMYFMSEKSSKSHNKTEKILPFIKLCIKCAWLASIQDRPVYATFKVKKGSPFYPEVMNSRNNASPEVDYLVWPIVCLYDKGPLVLRGIVQCLEGR